PSKGYGGVSDSDTEPPEILKKVRANAFLKISLGAIFRKTKRQIIGALCITACIISICVGLEGVFTIGYPIDAVYGGRYHYDLTVRNLDEDSYFEIESSVTGIKRIEPFIYFSSHLNGERVRVSTIPSNAELTTLYNASNERLLPNDGIIIGEMRAKINGFKIGDTVNLDGVQLSITGIAREILYNVLYVSEDTALKMGHSVVNGAMITLKEGVDVKDVEERISQISSTAYFTLFSLQKENIKNGFVAMRTVMAIFAVIAFLIGSLLIINLTLIDFNESKRKFATLRALGTPVKRINEISSIQNLFRILSGIILAFPLTYISCSVLLELISTASQQYVMVRFTECLIVSCSIPLIYVIIGTAVFSNKIKNFNFCDYLNDVV
ncbi:MAG: ABC transporter permease, partial [Firmicutes bacterium]|nr:ABC transporter permease [Candidatus Caballimonas caccae]